MMKRRNILGLFLGTPIAVTQLFGPDTEAEGAINKHLHRWKSQPRYPVLESSDPMIQTLIAATISQEPVAFSYQGGSTPGQIRIASIESVFHAGSDSHTYVATYCHLRRAHRVFRTDRITLK